MKKIILILMSLISLSLAADGWGVDVGTKISSVKDKNVLGIQSVKELAGDGGTEVYIESFYKHQFAQVGLRYTNLNEVNDNKIDLTWKLHLNDKSESDIKFFLNGGFGFGMQGSRTSTISTNITKTEYITSSNIDAYKVSSKADIDSTTYLSFSIGLGTSYNFTKNFKILAGYEFERKSLDLDYKVQGKNEKISLSGVNLDSHGVRVGLAYIF